MSEKILEDDILSNLNKYFNLKTLRPGQLSIIQRILEGKDVIVSKESGFGKTLCYQLPGLMKEGVVIVVSPLQSYVEAKYNEMSSQINAKCVILSNSVMKNENDPDNKQDLRSILKKKNKVWEDLKNIESTRYKFLFVTLDYFVNSNKLKNAIRDIYQKNLLLAIVIDEVQFMTQWTYSFRDDYFDLGALHDSYPETSFLCFMGPVGERKLLMIQDTLRIGNAYIFNEPSIRENLSFKVMYIAEKLPSDKLIEFINTIYDSKSGYIYGTNEEDCQELVSKLEENKIRSIFINNETTEEKKSWLGWIHTYGVPVVIVCLSGTKLDINLQNVDFVMHLTLPTSLEVYMQEAGRAGQNGNRGDCIIFYCNNNYDMNVSSMTDLYKEKLKRVAGEARKKLITELKDFRSEMFDVVIYAENISVCRQVFLLKYFNEEVDAVPCGVCDICDIMEQSYPIEMSPSLRKILMAVWAINRCQKANVDNEDYFYATVDNITDLLLGIATKRYMGSRFVKEWFFGCFASWEPRILQNLIFVLLSKNFVIANHVSNDIFEVYQNLIITPLGQDFTSSNCELHVIFSRKDVSFKKWLQKDWVQNQFRKDLECVLLYYSLHRNLTVYEWYKTYITYLYDAIPGSWDEFKKIKLIYFKTDKSEIDEDLFTVSIMEMKKQSNRPQPKQRSIQYALQSLEGFTDDDKTYNFLMQTRLSCTKKFTSSALVIGLNVINSIKLIDSAENNGDESHSENSYEIRLDNALSYRSSFNNNTDGKISLFDSNGNINAKDAIKRSYEDIEMVESTELESKRLRCVA